MKTDSILMQIRQPVSAVDVKYEIFRALERACQLDAENISVEATDGRVILRGSVKSSADREEAERAAWNTPGVTEVRNDITVVFLPA